MIWPFWHGFSLQKQSKKDMIKKKKHPGQYKTVAISFKSSKKKKKEEEVKGCELVSSQPKVGNHLIDKQEPWLEEDA